MANKKKTITPPTQLRSNLEQDSFVERNIEKLKALRSWFLWYPDLAFDLLSPSVGGLKLCFDQRVSMRCDSRFAAFHTCQPRGSAKTFGNIWVAIVDSIVACRGDKPFTGVFDFIERASASGNINRKTIESLHTLATE